MKISEIKTTLFTRTTITDYGIKFESFNRELAEADNAPENELNRYMRTVHVLKSGSININVGFHNQITKKQFDEIIRVRDILMEELCQEAD